jgi:hypothetical protein
MMLRYGRRHEHRWSFTPQGWLPFLQARLQALHASGARRRAADPAAPALPVRATDCAMCAAPPWPLAPSPGVPHGRHRREP